RAARLAPRLRDPPPGEGADAQGDRRPPGPLPPRRHALVRQGGSASPASGGIEHRAGRPGAKRPSILAPRRQGGPDTAHRAGGHRPWRPAMNLQQLIEQYLTFQGTLGRRIDCLAEILRPFGSALGPGADIRAVTAEYVKEFLTKGRPITSTYFIKYQALRSFYRYAQSRGYTGGAPLPVVLPKRPERVRPYIYSRDEVRRLLAAVDSLQEGYRGYR